MFITIKNKAASGLKVFHTGEKKKPISPDIVSGVIFTKEIYPADLTTLSQMAGAYVHEDMKVGENGVYLTVIVEGNPISEALMLNFSEK